MLQCVIRFCLTAAILELALSTCLESSDCASICDCRETTSGTKYCFNNNVYREEIKSFKCASRCGGFESPGCTIEPQFNLSDCKNLCQRCLGDAVAEVEGKCAPSRASTPSPSPRTCVKDSDCATECTCYKPDSGDTYCRKNGMFREEITRLDCVNKCGGLDRPGCRYLPEGEFNNCTRSCLNCLSQGLGLMKEKCGKPENRAENSTSTFTPNATASPTETPAGPCVSTLWLASQGLSEHVIYNGGHAPVICIPGLPCGTPGHLLRVCNEGRTSCRLVSYEGLCKQRADCSTSVMQVSQLSHTYDWSIFQTSQLSSQGTIELTSLSQNFGAKGFLLSNVIARATDLLNRNGFGRVCNAIARIPHSIRKVSYVFQVTEAS